MTLMLMKGGRPESKSFSEGRPRVGLFPSRNFCLGLDSCILQPVLYVRDEECKQYSRSRGAEASTIGFYEEILDQRRYVR